MKVTIKRRPEGGYNGQAWPAVGETIDLPDHVAESMIGAGDVVKPGSKDAKEAKAEADADAKAQKAADDARAAIEKAEREAAEAEAKVEAAVAPTGNVETATKKTAPAKARPKQTAPRV